MKITQFRSIIQISTIALLSLISMGCSPSVTDNAPESIQSKTEKPIAKAELKKSSEPAAAIDEFSTEPTEVPAVKVADRPKDENERSQYPAAEVFIDGDYRDGLDSGESGLEIQGMQYRHTSEMGTQEWQSIRQLTFIKDGVVLDQKKSVWCLSSRMPLTQDMSKRASCSKDGWVRLKQTSQVNLPFVGKRRFNFLGGTGTGQSITIEANGDTIVQLHGTESSSIQFRGQFSNLEQEMKLQIQGDTISEIDSKGNICSSNNSESGPCKAKLY